MDPEKTMEFILEQQASMSARQDAILNMIEAGMKLIARHDRQIKALADGFERVVESQGRLVHAQQTTEERLGRLADAQQTTEERLGRLGEAQQSTERTVERLAAAQASTDEKLNRLIDTLQRNASNGRPPA